MSDKPDIAELAHQRLQVSDTLIVTPAPLLKMPRDGPAHFIAESQHAFQTGMIQWHVLLLFSVPPEHPRPRASFEFRNRVFPCHVHVAEGNDFVRVPLMRHRHGFREPFVFPVGCLDRQEYGFLRPDAFDMPDRILETPALVSNVQMGVDHRRSTSFRRRPTTSSSPGASVIGSTTIPLPLERTTT